MAKQTVTTVTNTHSPALPWIRLLLATMLLLGCKQQTAIVKNVGTDSPASSDATHTPVATDEMMVYGKVPPFQLTNQNGETFDSKTLNGQVYLVNFFFTTCPSTCPQQSREIAALQNVDGLAMLSITVQPNVDTPEALSRYAKQYKADAKKWHFLTGQRDALWDLSKKGFMLPVGDTPEPAEMPIFHSSKIILVDGQQQIRGFYESQTRDEMTRLRKDTKQLIAENQSTNSITPSGSDKAVLDQ